MFTYVQHFWERHKGSFLLFFHPEHESSEKKPYEKVVTELRFLTQLFLKYLDIFKF